MPGPFAGRFVILLVCLHRFALAQILVSTYAGNGTAATTDGPALSASFNGPAGLAFDPAGNLIVADRFTNILRNVTSSGFIKTIAGTGAVGYADGPGATAMFKTPNGIATDSFGNAYVGEFYGYRVRKITPDGIVSTLAGNGTIGFVDGAGLSAKFKNSSGVVADAYGNIFVADWGNHAVRRITPTGIVTTLAGNGSAGAMDGVGSNATFRSPVGICIDSSGNIYTADMYGHRIRKVTQSGVVTTIAGNGSAGFADGFGSSVMFNGPNDVAVDARGNVFVLDSNNYRVRMITPNGTVSTVAGTGEIGHSDGPGKLATFNWSFSMTFGPDGNLYISDFNNNVIRMITGLNGPNLTLTSSSTNTPNYDNAPTKSSDNTTKTVLAISIPILVVVVSVIAGIVYMRSRNLRLTYIWYHGYPKLVLVD